jgi:predicted  nucleic acid-binding Zn-ribbon protein
MSRLDSAIARFSAALDALERAAQARLSSDDQLPAALTLIAALKADKAQLEAELDALLEERERLEGLNDEVAGRLDTAIRDIRSALTNEAPN